MAARQVSATAIVAAAAILVGQACRDPTEIRVDVTTTIDCSHIRNVTIAVGAVNGLESRPAGTLSTSCDANGNIGTLVVIPSGASGGEVGIRVIAGLDGLSADDCLAHGNVGGCVIARRALRFVDHSALTVPVSLEPDCRDVPCTPDSTCAKGACVPSATSCSGATCTIESPPADGGASDGGASDGGASDGGASDGASASDAGTSRWLALPSMPRERAEHVAKWTGSEVWIWGGSYFQAGFANDGTRYAPSSQTWSAIPAAPINGGLRLADLASTELIIWGSASDAVASDGARFDGANWSKVSDPTTFPGLAGFASRDDHLILWADSVKKMIVWGGNNVQSATTLADGALYDPMADSWAPMAASPLTPRATPGGVMVGGKLVVFGGYCSNGCAAAAIYDPAANSWSPLINVNVPGREPALSLTDGKRAYFWGGQTYSAGPEQNDLVIIDPATLAVEVRTGANAPSARATTAGWMSGGKLWLWGGAVALDGGSSFASIGDGASYDIATDRWTPMPTAGAPTPRRGHTITWTGTQAILVGGRDASGGEQRTGAIFVP